ncbi:hypothetical protein BB559_001645 [Furculomyces boomerangus]|uniref:NADH dehydrogenase [ubiquinone] 1 beta subcomplex subunit 8, mitochondrial n=1 Tax=Furculomyces boomerangus TaxID=61424 RepID=A0A2T9Z188_9FUNG|nr:hypothetical protein BB559_001645 [Furculomyces boomerangus]
MLGISQLKSFGGLRVINPIFKKSNSLGLLGVKLRMSSTENTPRYKEKYYVDPDPQAGDYPNLPWIKSEEKTPYGWWDRQNRRNFGEPVHEHFEILGMQTNSVYPHPSWSKVLLQWTVFVSILGGGAFIVSYFVPEKVAIPRHYPFEGLKNEHGGVPVS